MMKTIFATLVFVFATAANAAGTSAAAAVAANTSGAESFKIDTQASTVTWKGTKKTGSDHHGLIGVKDGEIQVDKKGKITGGQINIDMAKITNDDLKDSPDYQKKLVGHLSNEDFFNVTKFPTSSFKVTSVTSKAKDEVLVKGELTMIGKTNPIEFPAKITTDKGVMTGEAVVKIDRTKWGLKYGSGNFFKELTADKIINDEFELTLKLVAKK